MQVTATSGHPGGRRAARPTRRPARRAAPAADRRAHVPGLGPRPRARGLRGRHRRRLPCAECPHPRGARGLARGASPAATPHWRPRGGRVGPWALNLVTHSTYDRLGAELELVDRYRPPIVITALGSPAPVVERVHAYGGLVIADVSSVALARKAAAARRGRPRAGVRWRRRPHRDASPLSLSCPRCAASSTACSWSAAASAPAVRSVRSSCSAPTSSMPARRSSRRARASPATRYRDMVVRASVEDLVLSRALTGADAWYLRESIVAAGLDPDALSRQVEGGLARLAGPAQGVEGHLVGRPGRGAACGPSSPSRAIVERLAAEYAAAAAHGRRSPEAGDGGARARTGWWARGGSQRWQTVYADGTDHRAVRARRARACCCTPPTAG